MRSMRDVCTLGFFFVECLYSSMSSSSPFTSVSVVMSASNEKLSNSKVLFHLVFCCCCRKLKLLLFRDTQICIWLRKQCADEKHLPTMKYPPNISMHVGLKEPNGSMKSVCDQVRVIFECW